MMTEKQITWYPGIPELQRLKLSIVHLSAITETSGRTGTRARGVQNMEYISISIPHPGVHDVSVRSQARRRTLILSFRVALDAKTD